MRQAPAQATAPATLEDADATAPRPVHYVLSSHWDREWHQPFEAFRFELVDLLDDVLDAVAAGTLAGPFYCDGQSIVLEDYLEARPERRDELAAALRDGAVVAGPFYVLPDELSVSGESMIRNLQRGRRIVRELGAEPSNAGFLCDLFGHHSQMPQILMGFGIGGAYLWRGVNLHEARQFLWKGADGTTLPTHRFGTNGYWGFAVNIARFTNYSDPPQSEEQFAARLRAYTDDEAERTEVGPVLVFDGPDHNQLDAKTYRWIRDRLGELDGGGYSLSHVSLDEHQAAMLAEAEKITRTVEGELLEPARFPLSVDQQWLVGGSLASRVWMKQANSRCQALLCHWAEPWGALTAGLRRRPEAPGLLDHAWRQLLTNHAHDSICGCSIDAVHRDMAGRFRRAEQIATTAATRSLRLVAASVDQPLDDGQQRIVVFNPLPREAAGVRELSLDVPADWATAPRFRPDTEPVAHLELLDEDGELIPWQPLEQQRGRTRLTRLPGRSPHTEAVHRVRVAVDLDLPAMGYRTLRLRRASDDRPLRMPGLLPGLAVDGRTVANQHLSATAEPDGTVTLHDQRTGRTLRGLLGFDSSGDIGDGWNYEGPFNNRTVASVGSPARIALVEDGPLQATLEITSRMAVPEAFDDRRQQRSERDATLTIRSRLTLRKGGEAVGLRIDVDNTAKDHRLRVLLPSGTAAQTYQVDSPFDVVTRRVKLPTDAADYREAPVPMSPQQSWTAVHEQGGGLAVVAAGLMETGVLDRPGRPITLTLLRANGRTAFTEGEPDGQLLGRHRFDLELWPLDGEPDARALTEAGQRLNAGPRAIQLDAVEAAAHASPKAMLPPRTAVASLTGDAVLTSLRTAEGSTQARLFNPTDRPVRFTLALHPLAADPPPSATPIDFDGRTTAEPLRLDRGQLTDSIPPKRIQTYRFSHE